MLQLHHRHQSAMLWCLQTQPWLSFEFCVGLWDNFVKCFQFVRSWKIYLSSLSWHMASCGDDSTHFPTLWYLWYLHQLSSRWG
jgi:hypothetical protein